MRPFITKMGKSFVVASTLGMLAHVAFAEAQTVVNVAIKTIYAPVGFDDNDQATVVVEGYLPSSCYKLDDAKANIDQINKKIKCFRHQ